MDPQDATEVGYFAAPWGRSLKMTTTAAVIILLAVPFTGLLLEREMLRSLGWLFVGIPLGILVGCGIFMVNGYVVEPGMVWVERLQWRTPVALAGLRRLEIIREDARPAWRLFGNGGLFAYVGWFANSRVGRYRAFATDFRRSVLLQYEDHRVVLTPDDPERFVEAVEAASLARKGIIADSA